MRTHVDSVADSLPMRTSLIEINLPVASPADRRGFSRVDPSAETRICTSFVSRFSFRHLEGISDARVHQSLYASGKNKNKASMMMCGSVA